MKSILSIDLSASIRYLRRRPIYTIGSMLGLSVGIAASFMIGLWLYSQFSYNAYHDNADSLYRLVQDLSFGEKTIRTASLPAALGPIIANEQPEVVASVRFRSWNEVRVAPGTRSEPRYENRFLFSDSTIFSAFSFPLLYGDPNRALERPNTVVLAASAARDYFGTLNAIGQTLVVADTLSLTVTGIASDPPPSSTIQFRFLASFSTLERLETANLDDWGANNYPTYLLLRDEASISDLEAAIEDILMTRSVPERDVAANIQLEPITETYFAEVAPAFGPSGNRHLIYAFLFVGLLTLGTSLFNFSTLTAAYFRSRLQEIGIRQSLGAVRRYILSRFLSESFLLSAGSLLLAVGWTILIAISMRQFFPGVDVAHYINLPIALAFAGTTITVATVSGIVPILRFSGRDPSRSLRSVDAAPSSTLGRRMLVALQFTVCISLIAVTVLAWNQVSFMRTTNPGLSPKDVIVVPLRGTPVSGSTALTLRDEMAARADVESASVTSTVPTSTRQTQLTVSSSHVDGVPITAILADGHLVEVLRLQITAGDSFTGRDADRKRVLLNEAAVQALGLQTPVGSKIRYQGGQIEREVEGVLRDFQMTAMRKTIEPVMIEYGPGMFVQHLVIRTGEGEAPAVKSALKPLWMSLSPGHPLRMTHLDDAMTSLYDRDSRTVELFGAFSLLAVAVALIGLFGLTTFTLQQKRKDVAVRRTFGASTIRILQHLSRQTLGLVGTGFILAIPVTWISIRYWLTDFAYAAPPDPLAYLASGGAVCLVILATFAAGIAPVLRSDPAPILRAGE